MGIKLKRAGSLLGLLFILTLLSPLIDPAECSPKREQNKKHDQLKRTGSSSGSKLASVNSTRSARQIPEIPALYSAPKTPDIPALYSAPKAPEIPALYSAPKESGQDYEGMVATTEVTIGGPEPEEDSSEDYQYLPPTEKYPLNDSNQDDDPANPTDSPAPTSRTNEVEPEQDSYSLGYNNRRKEPMPEYGPPQPFPQYGPPQPPPPSRQQTPPPLSPPGRNSKNGNGSKRKMPQNRRPSDQQQIENSVQPMTQTRQNKNGNQEPQNEYLPPSTQPQKQENPEGVQKQQNNQSEGNAYGQNPNQYEPSNREYLPPQQIPQNNVNQQGEQRKEQHSSFEGYPSTTNSGTHPQDLSPQRSSSFPREGSQEQRKEQYSGRDANQPNSFYGPPRVNHFESGDELEGLNEKIVDAELLQRVQQIIEDHERQQKVILDKIQKENEKAFPSSSFPTGSGPQFIGNEINGPNDFVQNANPPGYNSHFSAPNYNFKSGVGDGPGGSSNSGASPYPYFNSVNSPPSSQGAGNGRQFPNDYSNSFGNGNKQPQPNGGYPGKDDSASSSSFPAFQSSKDTEPRKLTADVEYQKAVLSTHFTETSPNPGFGKPGGNSGYQEIGREQQLNSVAGPGEEYLPPAPQNRQEEQGQARQGYENQRNLQPTYSSPFSPENPQVQSPDRSSSGEQEGYSVKVGAGILVAGEDNNGNSAQQSIPSFNYGPPAQFQSQRYPPSQNGLPLERQQSPNSVPPPSQENFIPSQTNPPFWSRTSEPQPSYGPPLIEVQSPSPYSIQGGGTPPPGELGRNPQVNYSNNPENPGSISRSQNDQFPQYLPPVVSSLQDYTTSSPLNVQQQTPALTSFTATPKSIDGNGNRVMLALPRPIYGVPLAPVITLDSDNNLHASSGQNRDSSGQHQVNPVENYSPDNIQAPTPQYGLPGQGQFERVEPHTNYLPPASPFPTGNLAGQQDLSNSLHLASGGNNLVGSYGFPDNNPSSSSSTYLSVQGHNGNSNNHIYNINHNGYDAARVQNGRGDDSSSILIPGVSNTFSLPIYNYSPSSHEQAASSSSQVVLPLEQILQQLPQFTLDGSSSPSIFYGERRQDNFRVSRRALSKKANISQAPARVKSKSS